jgi:hypothetical protein
MCFFRDPKTLVSYSIFPEFLKNLRIKEPQVWVFFYFFGIEKPLASSFKTLKRTCGFQGITGKVTEF